MFKIWELISSGFAKREKDINALSAAIVEAHREGVSDEEKRRKLDEITGENFQVELWVKRLDGQKRIGPKSVNYPLKPNDETDYNQVRTIAIGQNILLLLGILPGPIETDADEYQRTCRQLNEIADGIKWDWIDRPALIAALSTTHTIKKIWRLLEDPRAELYYTTEIEIRAADERLRQIMEKNPPPV